MNRERIVELDKLHVWHPYTAMSRYVAETDPLVIVRAEGSRLFDADGRSYFDANSSWYCAALGHRHPRLVAALREQAETLCHVALAGVTHEPAARLAAELAARAPGRLPHVFFSDQLRLPCCNVQSVLGEIDPDLLRYLRIRTDSTSNGAVRQFPLSRQSVEVRSGDNAFADPCSQTNRIV